MSKRLKNIPPFTRAVLIGSAAVVALSFIAGSAWADVQKEISEEVSGDKVLASFYEARSHEPLWVGKDRAAKKRRKALVAALADAGSHGLPVARYNADHIEKMLRKSRKDEDKAKAEVAATEAFLRYARDVRLGILKPSSIDPGIKRKSKKVDPAVFLNGVSTAKNSEAYFASLPPVSQQYKSLYEEMNNLAAEYRPGTEKDNIEALLVAMERERWIPRDLGDRHVLVNQPEFVARIVSDDKVEFETRTVIGKRAEKYQSPEFSDEMEHMVINPSWYVPRSIATEEYLPKMQADPLVSSYLEMTDENGNVVDRATVDFASYTMESFPYSFRQPPSTSNALGQVKFMFPNRHNIYLHDTPAKSLFDRDTRAFSHGCIRLHKPEEFAYALLSVQEDDGKDFYHAKLDTGRETQVDLVKHVPVHLLYRTAFFAPGSDEVQYFDDVYGRDAKIWRALAKSGVEIPSGERVGKRKSGNVFKKIFKKKDR